MKARDTLTHALKLKIYGFRMFLKWKVLTLEEIRIRRKFLQKCQKFQFYNTKRQSRSSGQFNLNFVSCFKIIKIQQSTKVLVLRDSERRNFKNCGNLQQIFTVKSSLIIRDSACLWIFLPISQQNCLS